TGKQRDLTVEDLDRPDVDAAAKAVESSVVHYGDTTLTFLNNWYRNDARGTALTYVSAVAVEEKSVIDYNKGNPDGILQPGERPRPPRVPLVAVYPKEGTLFSDSPFYILNAEWVTPQQRTAAEAFQRFVNEPANQKGAQLRVPARQPGRRRGRPHRLGQRRRSKPAPDDARCPRPTGVGEDHPEVGRGPEVGP